MAQDVREALKSALQRLEPSKSVKDRKDGWTSLCNLSNSPQARALLDASTTRAGITGPPKRANWPRIAEAMFRYVEQEYKGTSKTEDNDVKLANHLKTVLMEADGVKNTVRKPMLLMQAGSLFEHMRTNLQRHLGKRAGIHYLNILNKVLLGQPAYPPLSDVVVFQDIMVCLMDRVRSMHKVKQSEAHTGMGLRAAVMATTDHGGLEPSEITERGDLLGALTSCLAQCPGDITHTHIDRQTSFWSNHFKWMQRSSVPAWLARPAFLGLATFIQQAGPDLGQDRARQLVKAMHPVLTHTWSLDKNIAGIKDPALQCMTCFLLFDSAAPGSVLTSDMLDRWWELVARDIAEPNFKWESEVAGDALGPTSRSSTCLLQLSAALLAARHTASLTREPHVTHVNEAGAGAIVLHASEVEAMDAMGSGASMTAAAGSSKQSRAAGASKRAREEEAPGAAGGGGGGSVVGFAAGGDQMVKKQRVVQPIEEVLHLLETADKGHEKWAPVLAMLLAQNAHHLGPLVTHLPSTALVTADAPLFHSNPDPSKQASLLGLSNWTPPLVGDGLLGKPGALLQLLHATTRQLQSGFPSGGPRDISKHRATSLGWLLRVLAGVARTWHAGLAHPTMAIIHMPSSDGRFLPGSAAPAAIQAAKQWVSEGKAILQHAADQLWRWLSEVDGALPSHTASLMYEVCCALAVIHSRQLATCPSQPLLVLAQLSQQHTLATSTIHSGLIQVVLGLASPGLDGSAAQHAASQQLLTSCVAHAAQLASAGASLAAIHDATTTRSPATALQHVVETVQAILGLFPGTGPRSVYLDTGNLVGHHAQAMAQPPGAFDHNSRDALPAAASAMHSTHSATPIWLLSPSMPEPAGQASLGQLAASQHLRQEQLFPLPTWCPWDDAQALQQRQLSRLVHGLDRWQRLSHAAATSAHDPFLNHHPSPQRHTQPTGDSKQVLQLQASFIQHASKALNGALQDLAALTSTSPPEVVPTSGLSGQAGASGGGAQAGGVSSLITHTLKMLHLAELLGQASVSALTHFLDQWITLKAVYGSSGPAVTSEGVTGVTPASGEPSAAPAAAGGSASSLLSGDVTQVLALVWGPDQLPCPPSGALPPSPSPAINPSVQDPTPSVLQLLQEVLQHVVQYISHHAVQNISINDLRTTASDVATMAPLLTSLARTNHRLCSTTDALWLAVKGLPAADSTAAPGAQPPTAAPTQQNNSPGWQVRRGSGHRAPGRASGSSHMSGVGADGFRSQAGQDTSPVTVSSREQVQDQMQLLCDGLLELIDEARKLAEERSRASVPTSKEQAIQELNDDLDAPTNMQPIRKATQGLTGGGGMLGSTQAAATQAPASHPSLTASLINDPVIMCIRILAQTVNALAAGHSDITLAVVSTVWDALMRDSGCSGVPVDVHELLLCTAVHAVVRDAQRTDSTILAAVKLLCQPGKRDTAGFAASDDATGNGIMTFRSLPAQRLMLILQCARQLMQVMPKQAAPEVQDTTVTTPTRRAFSSPISQRSGPAAGMPRTEAPDGWQAFKLIFTLIQDVHKEVEQRQDTCEFGGVLIAPWELRCCLAAAIGDCVRKQGDWVSSQAFSLIELLQKMNDDPCYHVRLMGSACTAHVTLATWPFHAVIHEDLQPYFQHLMSASPADNGQQGVCKDQGLARVDTSLDLLARAAYVSTTLELQTGYVVILLNAANKIPGLLQIVNQCLTHLAGLLGYAGGAAELLSTHAQAICWSSLQGPMTPQDLISLSPLFLGSADPHSSLGHALPSPHTPPPAATTASQDPATQLLTQFQELWFVRRFSGSMVTALLCCQPSAQAQGADENMDVQGDGGPWTAEGIIGWLDFLCQATFRYQQLTGQTPLDRPALADPHLLSQEELQPARSELLLDNVPMLLAVCMPDKALAEKVLNGQVTAACASSEALEGRLITDRLAICLGFCLTAAYPAQDIDDWIGAGAEAAACKLGSAESDKLQPARPFNSVANVLVSGFAGVYGQGQQGQPSHCAHTFENVSCADLMRIILEIFHHITSIPCPRHQLQRLAAVRVVVSLLDQGQRLGEPAIARLLIRCLTPLLQSPLLQPAACHLLQPIIAALLRHIDVGPIIGNLMPAEGDASASPASIISWPELTDKDKLQVLADQLPVLASCLAHVMEANALKACAGWWMRVQEAGGAGLLAGMETQQASDPAYHLLMKLIQAAGLKEQMSQLDPLPPLSALRQVTQQQEAQQSSITLLDQIKRFTSRVMSMSHSTRSRVIAAISARLSADWDSLLEPAAAAHAAHQSSQSLKFDMPFADLDAQRAGLSKVLKPDAQEAVWQLVRAAAQLEQEGGPQLAQLASGLLAAMNPCGNSWAGAAGASDHQPEDLSGYGFTATGPAPLPKQRGAAPSASNKANGSRQVLMLRVCKQLAECLTDGDLHVIAAAQDAIRCLLLSDDGRALLAYLKSTGKPEASQLCAQLRAFSTQSPLQPAPPNPPPLPHVDLSRAATWQTHSGSPASTLAVAPWSLPGSGASNAGRSRTAQASPAASVAPAATVPYDLWVTRLAAALLAHCQDSMLHVVGRVARFRSRLAQMLLPHILQELVLQDDGGLLSQLSQQITRHVLEPVLSRDKVDEAGWAGQEPSDGSLGAACSAASNEQCDVAAARMVLQCLNHLRNHHLDDVLANANQNLADQKQKLAQLVKNKVQPPRFWSVCYALKIDYLLVARVAASCGWQQTSEVYLEHWLEERVDRLQASLDCLSSAAVVAGRAATLQSGRSSSVGLAQAGSESGSKCTAGAPAVLSTLTLDPTLLDFVGQTGPDRSQSQGGRSKVREGSSGGGAARAGRQSSSKTTDAEQPQLLLPILPQEATQALALFKCVWTSPEDPDRLHALAQAGGAPPDTVLSLYEQEGDWLKALNCYDLALTGAASGSDLSAQAVGRGGAGALTGQRAGGMLTARLVHQARGAAEALKHLGLSSTASIVLSHVMSQTGMQESGAGQQAAREVAAELAWRLGRWDEWDDVQQPGHTHPHPSLPGARPVGSLGQGNRTPEAASLPATPAPSPLVFLPHPAGLLHRNGLQGQQLASSVWPPAVFSPSPPMHGSPQPAGQSSAPDLTTRGWGGSAAAAAAALGFHSALVNMLRALQQGNGYQFKTVLQAVTADCMQQLAAAGLQAPTSSISPLTQLHVTHVMSHFWQRRWGSSNGMLSTAPFQLDAHTASVDMPPTSVHELLCAVRCAAAQAAGETEELCRGLARLAAIHRRQGAITTGLSDIQKLRHLLHAQLLRLSEQTTTDIVVIEAPGTSRGTTPEAAHQPDSSWVREVRGPAAPWRLEEAHLTWHMGEVKHAARRALELTDLVKSMVPTGRQAQGQGGLTGFESHLATALSLAGNWAAEAQVSLSDIRSSNPASRPAGRRTDDVLDVMLEAAQYATSALTGPEQQAGGKEATGRAACRVFYHLAEHTYQLYQASVRARSTPEYHCHTKIMKERSAEIKELHDTRIIKATSKNEKVALMNRLTRLQKEASLDKSTREAAAEAEAAYMDLAITNYTKCIKAGSLYDVHVVYRLVNMWLTLGSTAQTHLDTKAFNERMQSELLDIPTHKIVPVFTQLSSRLSSIKADDIGFQKALHVVLKQVALDHPYHVLYPLFALKKGVTTGLPQNQRPGPEASSGVMQHTPDTLKVAAATELLNSLSNKKNGEFANLVNEVERVLEEYCRLAATPPPAPGQENKPLHLDRNIRKRLTSPVVPIISHRLPIDPSKRYTDLPFAVEWSDQVMYVGGINAPKLIKCWDAAGVQYKQLVKSGNDDLRQDATIQQCFSLMNALLADDREAAERKLGVATYKVVPFSPTAGLVEWVPETQSMSEYLFGLNHRGGAHERYRTTSRSVFHVATKLKSTGANGGELREVFDASQREIRPVFHKFFVENFRSPAAWAQARTTYARSLAVSSMAGWVVGLGDRHSGNILIHLKTGTCVHIDLGIAFEQGMLLFTPERVPFRLTRDVVDGCGAAGLEGPVRRCAEITLRVLRQHKEALTQVVEVLLHDPLYKWVLTYKKACRVQSDDEKGGIGKADEEEDERQLGNVDAERVVLRVKQKLEGIADGVALPVPAQVTHLFNQAQDPEHLCRMYPGWMPHV